MILSSILAVSDNYAIGINNQLPWEFISRDMKWFKEKTRGLTVVMGSKTWDSLPRKPLPQRTNVVLTTREHIDSVDHIITGDEIQQLTDLFPNQEVVVIGGAQVYLKMWPHFQRVYVTRVHQVVAGDTFLNIDDLLQSCDLPYTWTLVSSEHHVDENITFEIWEKK